MKESVAQPVPSPLSEAIMIVISVLALLFNIIFWPSQAEAYGFQALLTAFSDHDRDGDGLDEIESLSLMSHTAGDPNPHDRVVVVFVESRLLQPLASSSHSETDLVARLQVLAGDLRAEGYVPKFVETSVFSDPAIHQDGKTLLAMRSFLQEVRSLYPNLKGALLIGSFPEASLVRRWIWKRTGGANDEINDVSVEGEPILRIVPELIDGRAEIVLADLDGGWEHLYREGRQNVSGLWVKLDDPDWWPSGWSWLDAELYKWEHDQYAFEDFFFINDSQYFNFSWSRWGHFRFGAFRRGDFLSPGLRFFLPDLRLYMSTDNRHQELTAADRALSNPMARPDILVSRINPRHIAVEPDPAHDLLDSDGLPQTSQTNLPNGRTPWVRDVALERTILIDFLDRNHGFRMGSDAALPFRGAAITYPEDDFTVASLAQYVDDADPQFIVPLSAPSDPSLVEYVEWLEEPATLRGVMAHSSAWNTEFGSSYNLADLDSVSGGSPWRWKQMDEFAVPSFADQGGHADLYLHRTLWENQILADSGNSFFIHAGCHTNTPGGSSTRPYDDTRYGGFQNGEAQLFYLNGLAMISRAKVFYDRPRGIADSLSGERTPFGEIWPGTFDVDASDVGLEPQYASNKRAYNWSLTGDWSLRLRYDSGLGLFTGNLWRLEATPSGTVADQSWIDGWNFDSDLNTIHGAGDLDGDGTDEAIVTSAWGIGVFEHDGTRMRARVAKPNDSWFGNWRYNALHHAFDDEIVGMGDLDGDGRDEILIRSEWGIGILKRSGSTLTSLMTLADNQWAGGWRYETANEVVGIADLNGDGQDDIVITSAWGIGVLTYNGTSLTSLTATPNDTWFGLWRYNASFHGNEDTIVGFGDFDNDGSEDLLITSEWGIGILRLTTTGFQSLIAQPNDTWLGAWRYNASFHDHEDRILALADLNGDGATDILIGSEWGMGILERSGSTLQSRDTWENGEYVGHWRVDGQSDFVAAVADLTGDGREEVLLRSDTTGRIAMFRDWLDSGFAFYPLSHGDRSGHYVYRSPDEVVAIGDLDPSTSGEEVLFQR